MSASPERAKAYTLALLIGATVLLVLATTGLDGDDLLLASAGGGATARTDVVLENLEALHATEPFTKLLAPGRRDVFATDHFNRPKPPPAKPPAPAPPKTKSVSLTYLGLMGGGSAEPTAYLRSDKDTLRLGPGGVVIDDWRIAEIGREALVLTNNTAETHRLEFRRPAPLEVPIR